MTATNERVRLTIAHCGRGHYGLTNSPPQLAGSLLAAHWLNVHWFLTMSTAVYYRSGLSHLGYVGSHAVAVARIFSNLLKSARLVRW